MYIYIYIYIYRRSARSGRLRRRSWGARTAGRVFVIIIIYCKCYIIYWIAFIQFFCIFIIIIFYWTASTLPKDGDASI